MPACFCAFLLRGLTPLLGQLGPVGCRKKHPPWGVVLTLPSCLSSSDVCTANGSNSRIITFNTLDPHCGTRIRSVTLIMFRHRQHITKNPQFRNGFVRSTEHAFKVQSVKFKAVLTPQDTVELFVMKPFFSCILRAEERRTKSFSATHKNIQ